MFFFFQLSIRATLKIYVSPLEQKHHTSIQKTARFCSRGSTAQYLALVRLVNATHN